MFTSRETDLRAPHRGKPPPAPEGFVQDIGDAFLYHPVLKDCSKRISKEVLLGCCRRVLMTFCNQKPVSYYECKTCDKES